MSQGQRRARIHKIRATNRRIAEAKLAHSSAQLHEKEVLGRRIASLRYGSSADSGLRSGAELKASGELATRLDAALTTMTATLDSARRAHDHQHRQYSAALRHEAAAEKLVEAAVRGDRLREEHRRDAFRIARISHADAEGNI
jgi:hypothetical protein